MRTFGGEGILSVRLEKVMLMLFFGSSAMYEKVNLAYGVMTAICRRYLRPRALRAIQLSKTKGDHSGTAFPNTFHQRPSCNAFEQH